MDPNSPQSASSTATNASPVPPRKRTGWKIVKWTVLLLIVLVAAGATIVYLNLNSIVERTIESQATASTHLKTELGSARLSLFGGEVGLNKLEIGSPAGFAAPHMLTLGDADVKVSLNELRGDPVKIASITLDKPKLVIERGPDGQFNFKAAADQMPKTEEAPANEEPLKMIISELTVKDAMVVVRPGSLPIPGVTLPEEINLPIPTFVMKEIGSADGAKNGAAVKDVVMQVVTVLAGKAMESGGLPDQLKGLMNVDLEGAVAQLGGEAQKRIAAAVPGQLGQFIGGLDTKTLMKDPGAALKEGVGNRIGDLIGGAAGGSTQPSTQQSDPSKKAAEDAIKGLFGGKKKDGAKR
jgi:hypothetical protein